jgi:phage-related protein
MSSKWKVEFYREADGDEPVKTYLNSIVKKDRAILLATIDRLRRLGPEIQGTKMDGLIEWSIRELRKDRHRILYGRDGDTFALLSAFLKRTPKTPLEEKNLAKNRFQQYLNQRNS